MAPNKTTGATPPPLRLPDIVTGPADILRLTHELESLDDYLYQAGLREKDAPVKLPKTSRLFDALVERNKIDARSAAERKRLQAFLNVLYERAPVLHISFAVDPSSAFMAKIVNWLRQNISSYVLVQVGRQPTIGGGCIVRSASKQFDFSFHKYLSSHREVLAAALAEGRHHG